MNYSKKIFSGLILLILSSGSEFLFSEDFFQIRQKIIKDSRFRISSLYITPVLTLNEMGYTSNIYRYNNIAEPDWTMDLGLDTSIALPVGNRFIFEVIGHPYYSFYAENKEEQAFNNELDFLLYTYIGSFNLKFKYSINNVRQRPNSEFGKRVRYLRSISGLYLDFGRHDNFYITLYLEQLSSKHKDEQYLEYYNLNNQLNRNELQTGLRLNKIIFSRTEIFLNYEYSEISFDITSEKDGLENRISLGFTLPEIGHITGSFQLGYKLFQPKSPEINDFSSLFGYGNITIELTRRFRFKFNYLVDNFFSYWIHLDRFQTYFHNRAITGQVEFYLTRRLKLGASYQIGALIFKTLTQGLEVRRDQQYYSDIYLGIKVFKNTGIGLVYARYRFESAFLEFDSSYDFIGGYLIYDF